MGLGHGLTSRQTDWNSQGSNQQTLIFSEWFIHYTITAPCFRTMRGDDANPFLKREIITFRAKHALFNIVVFYQASTQ